MRYRWLGKTGLKVSEVGFGAWAIGGTWWGPQDDQDSRLALHQALDMGCNFIDTARVYGDGHSERLIAGVLEERTDHPVIATKVPPKNFVWDNLPVTPLSEVFPPEWIIQKTEESLKNLRRDSIDVLQLHTWRSEWNTQAGPLLETIARLKRESKIRAFGISLRDKGSDEANDLIRWRQVDVLQVFFNLLYQEPIERLFPVAKEYGVGIIARVPMAFGALSGRFNPKTRFIGDDHRRSLYQGEGLKQTLHKAAQLKFLSSGKRTPSQAAIQWTLAYPEVSTAIPGIRNLHQAKSNCLAGEGEPLALPLAKKAEKLYKVNFGLPVVKVSAAESIPAVFMSGIKIEAKAPSAKKKPVLKKVKKGKETKKQKKKQKEKPKKKDKKNKKKKKK